MILGRPVRSWLARSWLAARLVKPSRHMSTIGGGVSTVAPLEEGASRCKVIRIVDETHDVKSFWLHVLDDPAFTFHPGQWVDTFIPGLATVGGFSLASPPSLVAKDGVFQLTVKMADHPPARWLHSQDCKVGTELQVRVGGDVYLPEDRLAGKAVLLIGGGIGITPLYSMLQDICDGIGCGEPAADHVGLLYASKAPSDVLYTETLAGLSAAHGDRVDIDVLASAVGGEPLGPGMRHGRIDEEVLVQALQKLQSKMGSQPTAGEVYPDVVSYLCGPPGMADDVASILHRVGCNDVRYEKWW